MFRLKIFTSAVGVLAISACSWGQSKYVLDASNSEFNSFHTSDSEESYRGTTAFRGPASMGTVSASELANPLRGKGLSLLTKAQSLISKGDSAHAMEHLRAAIADQSAEPYALAMLATEHLRTGEVDTAIAEFQRAVQLLPGKAAVHSNLALALAIRGQNEAGLIEARKALQLDPGRPKVRMVLGQILFQMGRKEEAEFHLKKAAVEMQGARDILAKYYAQ